MKCQPKSMSGTLLGICHKMSAAAQNKFQVYISQMSAKCQVSYLEMLGTYPIADIHETVRYCNDL